MPQGLAWCPTPRARRAFKELGIPLSAPPAEVISSVLSRRFHAELEGVPEETVFCTEAGELLDYLARHSPQRNFIAKRAFGYAGRQQRRFRNKLSASDEAWLQRSFGLGGVLLEPVEDLDQEFVMHGFVRRDQSLHIAQYPGLQEVTVQGVIALRSAPELEEDLANALRREAERVGTALAKCGYFGPFGIDAFTFASGKQLRTRSEINARYTLGFESSFGADIIAAEAELTYRHTDGSQLGC